MLTRSENIRDEYCAQIVRIGKLEPIENSDFLAKTYVNNAYQVVVGKNDVKEGDIMVYCKLETAINDQFLSINNQYEIGEYHRNSNSKEVEQLILENRNDEAKKMVGYFNKHGRVRIVKLRGVASEGCLFNLESLYRWNSKLRYVDFEQYINMDENGNIIPFNFDTIDGKLFIQAYVPATPEMGSARSRRNKKRDDRIKKFDRMIDGQFAFHYDTNQLTDNIWKFNPETEITVTNKLHGTSHIVANILTKKPIPATIARKMVNKKKKRELAMLRKAPKRYYWQRAENKLQANRIKKYFDNQYSIEYGKVTSSRTIIKNKYINEKVGPGFYKVDIWSYYGDILYPFLDKGMTVYSEIVGYLPGSNTMIQKGYDYGCVPGTSFIMPYRITMTDEKGTHIEWEVKDVYKWTINLINKYPSLKNIVVPIEIFYQGKVKDLYPNIPVDENYGKNLIAEFRADKEHFGMEENEPRCKNKVPREGIVVRISNSPLAQAFKLKTFAYLGKEAKEIDNGNVDIEMQITY